MTQQVSEPAPRERQSRLGKRPIPIPKGVTVDVKGDTVAVQGPKGRLSMTLPAGVSVKREGDLLQVLASVPGWDKPRVQGLGRALVANMLRGSAEGFNRTLELVGTGYRGELKGKKLVLALGLSHPVEFELPPSISANIPPDSKGTIIQLTSPDKALLGQVCATLRAFRPPEPYAGKGVRFQGENVRRKAGKAGKK